MYVVSYNICTYNCFEMCSSKSLSRMETHRKGALEFEQALLGTSFSSSSTYDEKYTLFLAKRHTVVMENERKLKSRQLHRKV